MYTAVRDYQVYLIDEPSSYLDIKQRLTTAEVIRELVQDNTEKYCIVVEHDLAVLDYLSDYVSLLYGQPGAYGIITLPYGVREGINVFLAGYIPTENVRFRDCPIKFHVQNASETNRNNVKDEAPKRAHKKNDDDDEESEEVNPVLVNSYPAMSIQLGDF